MNRRFAIRDGIPILFEREVVGSNLKDQKLYDRLAPFHDLITGLYARWKGMGVEARVREYLDELEVTAGPGRRPGATRRRRSRAVSTLTLP